MNYTRLLKRSLCYHWRTNLAVMLGVIAGTAVIAGALVVGDSVRDSLRKMSLDRLGRIDHAIHSHRFFRESLADDLQQQPGFPSETTVVAPALTMEGGFEHRLDDGRKTVRVGRVSVYGVDDRLWQLTDYGESAVPVDREVTFSWRTAEQLRVKPGDEVSLWIELPSTIPRDTLLGGGDDQTSQEITLTVKEVLDETSGIGRLSLNPNQQLPLNAFVSLTELQSLLNLARVRQTARNRTGAPARVNTLFVGRKNGAALPDDISMIDNAAAESLTSQLADAVQFVDLGLRLQQNSKRGYLALESQQMILEDAFATAGKAAAEKLNLSQSPVLVYLANEFSNPDNSDKFSMYSIIAGIDLDQLSDVPFGPFEFVGKSPAKPLAADQIVLNEWLAGEQGLSVDVGGEVRIKYHLVGSHGELPEEEKTFKVAGILKLDGTPADDRGLTPEVKGITDVDDFRNWDQPFKMDLDRVTDSDDDYWKKYRATPKAFVSLATAQQLWRSRYGRLTSLRVSKLADTSLPDSAAEFERAFLESLQLDSLGLAFQPIKFNGLQAASGTTDFSGLFIGFSFFLILSAMILIGLLFRLGIERRVTGIGLFAAVGFSDRQVRRMLMTEGMIVVCVGGLIGLAAAVGYASLMVHGLKTWWIGAIGTKFLFVSVTPVSLVTGFVIAVAVASFAVWWALRGLRSLSTRELLSGVTEQALTSEAQRSRGRRASKVALASVVLAGVLLAAAMTGLIPTNEAIAGLGWHVFAFFIVGIAIMVASLTFLSAWLDSDRSAAVRGAGISGLSRLGLRNAARHRQRSVLSTGLIASATFVIVAVAAGQRNPAVETPEINSGNGGFQFVAESSTPVLFDLNSSEGRNKLNVIVDKESAEARLLDKMLAMPFRVKPGEDASCLNLYKTKLPTVLGVTPAMIERGGFKFADTKVDEPWELLNQELDDENGVPVIPVLGDMNTLTYSLKKGIGKRISVPDEEHPEYKLLVSGMFDGSVFQGVLLMSEANFDRLYQERAGYQYFLIGDRRYEAGGQAVSKKPATNPDVKKMLTVAEAGELRDLLETKLTAYGFDAERVVDRLASFLQVQNTYLRTFQALGGLGLLLGTLGLSTVMLRNVFERRSELALLRAVGFPNSSLALLVIFENAFLLLWGLTAGTISALLAMTPHLVSTGADVPWGSGGVILVGVFLVGMVAALLAVAEAVRTPILSTLRTQ